MLDINKFLPSSIFRINYFHASVGLSYYFGPITQDTYGVSDSLISLNSSGRLISVFWYSFIKVCLKKLLNVRIHQYDQKRYFSHILISKRMYSFLSKSK